MNENEKEILLFLFFKEDIKYSEFPTEITDKYENEYQLQKQNWSIFNLDYVKTPLVHSYKITDKGKRILVQSFNKRELKHLILQYLMKDKEKWFSKTELENATQIDSDKLDSIVFDMKEKEATVDITDSSSKSGFDYIIRINPKGKGYFIDKEYLKEEKSMPAFQEIHFGDKITTHGNESPAFGKGGTQTNTVQNELPKEKWYKKILNEFVKNAVQYIFTGVVTFIIGVAAGKSCNQHNNQQETKKDTTKIVQVPKKSIKL